MARLKLSRHPIGRAINLYGLPVCALGLLGWLMTTSPPAIVVIWAVIMLAPPLLGIARHQGYIDALRWANERVEQEKRP